MLKIVAKRYLRPGCLEEYIKLTRELVDLTRLEEGCVDYGLYYNKEQNIAVMMETWASQADLDRHLKHIIDLGWPEKLNQYADPQQKGGAEQYEWVY